MCCVFGLSAAQFASQIYSGGEIIKHKHILRPQDKKHWAVMLGVSRYELLRYEHFASSLISESWLKQLFEYLAKNCCVKNNRRGCLPYVALSNMVSSPSIFSPQKTWLACNMA